MSLHFRLQKLKCKTFDMVLFILINDPHLVNINTLKLGELYSLN